MRVLASGLNEASKQATKIDGSMAAAFISFLSQCTNGALMEEPRQHQRTHASL
jgi:hypothetical protein